MPVKVKKQGKKYRVVKAASGKVSKAKKAKGAKKAKSSDAGGHATKKSAVKQVQAINLSEMRRKGDKRAPPAPKKKGKGKKR